MTSKDKLIEKFKNTPQNIKYKEIETIFQNDDFIIKE
jgi:hypothetical protein